MSLPDDLDLFEQVAEAGILLAGERDLPAFLERCLTTARRLTRAEAGTVFLRAGNDLPFTVVQNDALVAHYGEVATRALFAERSLVIDESSLAGYVAASGQTVNVADAHAVLGTGSLGFDGSIDAATGYRTCSVLAVPLVGADGDTLGVLELINAVNDDGAIVPFDERLEVPVRWLAAQAAAAILRARELQDVTFVDSTTGLPNRRYLHRRADEEVARHRRFGHPVSVVLLSVDGLREVAAEDGQEVADDIVRGVGRRLAGSSRNVTVLARYGPETFAVLLANTARAGALAYARRIKRVADGQASSGDALTTSVGLASMPEDAMTVEELVETALDRVITARKSGGNTIRAQ